MWQKVAAEMQMPHRAVEYMALQLGQQELTVRANAPSGPTFFCSCGCDGFLPFGQRNPAFYGEPTPLCYICRHEWRGHDKMVVDLQEGGSLCRCILSTHNDTRPSQIPPEPTPARQRGNWQANLLFRTSCRNFELV